MPNPTPNPTTPADPTRPGRPRAPRTDDLRQRRANSPGGSAPSSPPTARDLLVALHADRRIGPAATCRLGGELEAWRDLVAPTSPSEADLANFAAQLGVPRPDLRHALSLVPHAARLADEERRRTAAAGGQLLTRLDDGYPRPLLDLPLAPPVLAVAGEIPAAVVEAGLAVAMVGSRRSDAYGLEVASHLARQLGTLGLTVVSGFALGVDTAAHRAALDGGGTTVAILGCGLDIDYPRGGRKLFHRITGNADTGPCDATGGAILTEFPCGIGPRPWHFPVRNRLIAALSLGTVVVRAAKRSGSLITARLALDLGREVLAVPGPIFDKLSAGPHRLLADGAALAATAQDVLDALLGPSGAWGLLRRRAEEAAERKGPKPKAEGESGTTPRSTTPHEGSPQSGALASAGQPRRGLPAKLLAAMPVGRERNPEALAIDLDLAIDAVLGALLELELTGWVRRLPGPAYVRCADSTPSAHHIDRG